MLDCDPKVEDAANQKRIDAVLERKARAEAARPEGCPPPFDPPTDYAGVYVDASFDCYFKVGVAIAVLADNDHQIHDVAQWSGQFTTSGEAEVAAIHLGLLLVRRKKLDVPIYSDYEGAIDAFRPAGRVVWLPRNYMGIPHVRASSGLHKMVKQLQNRERAGR